MTNSFPSPLLAKAQARALLRKSVSRLWRRKQLQRQRVRMVFSAFAAKLARQLQPRIRHGAARYSRTEVQRRLRLVGGNGQ